MSRHNEIRLGPTTKRIMHLSEVHLLRHYALIVNKASTLSSAQRKTVKYRIQYGLEKGNINKEKIEGALNDLALFVAQSITNQTNKAIDDNSSIKE